MKRSFVLARVGNRNFSSLSQHCGRCTYYLRRSWKRAKMPLNGHLRKPKTLCLLPSHYPFHEVKKGVADASRTSSPAPCFVWKHIFPQFFPPPIFRVLQRNRERFPSMIFFFFFFALLFIGMVDHRDDVAANCTCNCVITVGQHRH